MFGSVGPELDDMLESNPDMQAFFDMSGGDPVSAFLVTAFGLVAAVAGGFAVSSALRLRSEESAGRAESLLSTAMSRTRWAAGSLLVTVVATTVAMVLVGVGAATGYALAADDWSRFGRMTAAAAALSPGVLLLAGVAVLLLGWVPRLSGAAYALVVFAALQGYLGNLLDFPTWVQALSPFHHLPEMPVEDFAPVPVLVVLLLGLALGALGVVGLRRRDLA